MTSLFCVGDIVRLKTGTCPIEIQSVDHYDGDVYLSGVYQSSSKREVRWRSSRDFTHFCPRRRRAPTLEERVKVLEKEAANLKAAESSSEHYHA